MSCDLPDAHGPCSPGVQAAHDRLAVFKALDDLETDDAARLVRMARVVGLRPVTYSSSPLPEPELDFEGIVNGTTPPPKWIGILHLETGIQATFFLDEAYTGRPVYKAMLLIVDDMLLQVETTLTRGEVAFVGAGEPQIFPISPCECVFNEVTGVKVTQGMRDLHAAYTRETYLPQPSE